MPEQFSHLLKAYREQRRFSQERCATECEMDHSLVSRIEGNQRTPTRESVAKLCAGLDLAQPDADQLWLAAGFVPPDLSGGTDAATAIDLWRALGRAGEARRRAIEGVVAGTLVLATE